MTGKEDWWNRKTTDTGQRGTKYNEIVDYVNFGKEAATMEHEGGGRREG